MAKNEDNKTFREKYRIYVYPVVLAWIMTMLIKPITSDGIAMLPTVSDGEVIIVAKQTYTPKRGAPEFQQVVAFRDDFAVSGADGEQTIRRVIGLPGDKIEIKEGKVYRNDKIIKEEYVNGKTEGEVLPIILGKDEVFVLGDNREKSIDSRDPEVGALKMNLIRGYCVFTVWPVNEIGRVK